MAIRRGTAAVKKIYRGTVPIKRRYRGTQLVWDEPFFEAVPLYLYGSIPRYESTLGTITVPRAMTVDINLQITFRRTAGGEQARVTVNGSTVSAAASGGTAIVSIRRTVAAGAVITFKQYNNTNLASYRFIDDGYYNVTEVHL